MLLRERQREKANKNIKKKEQERKEKYLQQKTEKFHLFSSPDAQKMNEQDRQAEKWKGEKNCVNDLNIFPLWKNAKLSYEWEEHAKKGDAHFFQMMLWGEGNRRNSTFIFKRKSSQVSSAQDMLEGIRTKPAETVG